MRTVTKSVSLKIGESSLDFRLTKLDAFSGARLLKLISGASADNLQDLLFSLPEPDLDTLMRCCLRSASALLPAGPVRVLEGDCWGVPDLEYDAWTCLRLTQEVMAWTLEGFFPENAPAS